MRNRLGVGLALLAVYLIWGSTYLAIRITLESFPPFRMAGIRFVIAGSTLYLLLRLRGAAAPQPRQWAGAALVGALLLVGGNGGVIFAEQWVASGLAALGIATVPIWAALFAGLWGRWPTRGEWLGLGIGFVGVVLLNLDGNLRASPLGAITLLGAAMSWALGTVWSRRLSLPDGLMSSAAQMLTAGGLFLLISLVRGERVAALPSARSLLALLYLIVFGALVAFSAYTYLLNHVKPALATSHAYVNPIVAVALGVGIAGERITGVAIAAMLVILSGVGLLALSKGRPSAGTHRPQPQPTLQEVSHGNPR